MTDDAQIEYHPRLCGQSPLGLLGHQPIINRFLNDDERRHHGYIFQGPKGVGKASTAYRLAEHLLAQPDDGGLFEDTPAAPRDDDPEVSLLRAGVHPDLKVIEGDPDKANMPISVERIRTVIPYLAHTPSRGAMRVVLIDAMDQMNVNGANALLKTLEEPPENTVLIILHHGQTPILPTIRSRVQVVAFKPLSFDDTRRVIAALYPDAEENWVDVAAVLSEGAPGKAMMLAEAGAPDLYAETCMAFAQGPLNGMEIDRLASLWGAGGIKHATRRQLARQFFDRLLVKAARQCVDAPPREGEPAMDIEEDAVRRISARLSAYHLTEIRADLLAALYEAERLNLDAMPAIFTALEKMSQPS